VRGVFTADLGDVPGSVWAAASPAPVYTAREWLAASRWPGDGMRYLLAGGLMVPVRLVTEPAAWSRMNLVDICAGTAFGDWADAGAVASARVHAVPHLLVAAPGYFTVPIGPADGDVRALVDALRGKAGRLATPTCRRKPGRCSASCGGGTTPPASSRSRPGSTCPATPSTTTWPR
jgi:hypothetical protein